MRRRQVFGHRHTHVYSQVAYFFLKWVESERGGKGGRDWVNKHVAALANIAGPMLGVPKAVSALLYK
jgi:phospholipid:diacylglycerol acyltransferase